MISYTIDRKDSPNLVSIQIDRSVQERAEEFFAEFREMTYSDIIDLFLTREGYPAVQK
ncbi:MAG TPA: hypothetical protein O0X25_03950 [Methanocorpusculum sp.]|nr:hypothetical protein [Methanocorpusculum sp.]HJJ40332.1 hypothetical protein [Methanocorpusculum sp.]HJJ49751.1 hypothetical protein [Methanocorpusculum sp.]HJJ57583.1 hypothetical protein [Methanocorpusculum sp.]HJJ95912.1 hypothetical protein [Methanocorpusculum sp.]